MNRLRVGFLTGLILLSYPVTTTHALFVNSQNQIYAQSDEKLSITYIRSVSAHRGQILSIYASSLHKTIDTSATCAGETINLGSFSKETELIFQLLDPRTGFFIYNDPRSNVDLANHVRVTDLGQGKWLIGWQHDQDNESYDDLVIMVQKSNANFSTGSQRSAAGSWTLYE